MRLELMRLAVEGDAQRIRRGVPRAARRHERRRSTAPLTSVGPTQRQGLSRVGGRAPVLANSSFPARVVCFCRRSCTRPEPSELIESAGLGAGRPSMRPCWEGPCRSN